ncbi:hypothetical protein GKZ90_0017695 [Flavobacterium sp. MC2016-06]|jgi:hypothetical protein|uniref:hypothetical protein n=1 Tax=Flavobacterium sp. MC2016-06 TaxID=2676308 RepID=UPI0012BAF80A|nr:hypothetical protein [Flavobacterium sp. MC2016-06]MBU3860404.1 hypothetical protein [Flavobacterium sp. MC2016-06]
MKIKLLKLDYYSDFLGETEIRLYTNSKETVFEKNIKEYEKDKFHEIQLTQGENNIYFFSLWEGYFDSFIRALIVNKKEYQELPNFIKNWYECKGWRDIESIAELITENELDWIIKIIPEIIEQYRQSPQIGIWDDNCINDLSRFLNFVKNNNWELRICEE